MTANKRPYIVGLTGGIASGKSAAADYLATLGAAVIDADAISHQLTAKNGDALPAILEQFGEAVFYPDGNLNRRALANIIFSDARQRQSLEAIIHPMVQNHMLQAIDEAQQKGAPVVVLNVPLLFESASDVLCNECWVMALDTEKQLQRLMERDKLNKEEALARINSQMPLEEKKQLAHKIIETGRPINQTQQELAHLWKELVRRVNN